MFCKRFILHVTAAYFQHVFNVLKHLQNVLWHFFKCFGVKHILDFSLRLVCFYASGYLFNQISDSNFCCQFFVTDASGRKFLAPKINVAESDLRPWICHSCLNCNSGYHRQSKVEEKRNAQGRCGCLPYLCGHPWTAPVGDIFELPSDRWQAIG